MRRIRYAAPSGLVELLRLLCVLFFAGVGYQVAKAIHSTGRVLGPFDFITVGLITGSGVGYVLGGITGRSVAVAADRTERALKEVTVEALVAGTAGLVVGVLLAAAVSWPLFFLPAPLVSVPLFLFVVAVLGYVGFRVGVGKRESMIEVLGHRAGLAPRPVAAAALPRLLDTSVAVDGRIVDVVRAGFLYGRMLVAEPVLGELQGLADAGDNLRRSRGRRGLATLEALRREPTVSVEVVADEHPEIAAVDAKLVRAALDAGFALLTLDTNLARVAELAGVSVLNLHALALSLRPPVSAGDDIPVLLIKPGKEPGQAVGYLDDGTMVVIERARSLVGKEVTIRVTSVLTTANGRMVFGSLTELGPAIVAAPGSGASGGSSR
ncbi:MAG: TRAM domain-containing protein [Mycobacteriales bacterium]